MVRAVQTLGRPIALLILAAALGVVAPAVTTAGASADRSGPPVPRPLPGPLLGVTIDEIDHLPAIVAGLRRLPARPTARIYFDTHEPAQFYAAAVAALHPVSYIMGELLDSSDERSISTLAFARRARSYVARLGRQVDVWEIGNEVNGSRTGPYSTVRAKFLAGDRAIVAAGGRTALTLQYNVGCGDGRGELGPLAFSRRYVPESVRSRLSYVLLSYYEQDCAGRRPAANTWAAYFRALHRLYPHAQLGFGEVGLQHPTTARTLSFAAVVMRYYYGLRLDLPYYIGGYFWWYWHEDCLPWRSRPLWRTLRTAFGAEQAALPPSPSG